MTAVEQAQQVAAGAGWFRLARGLVEVTGGDATTWLNGMISNDVAALEASGPRSGCYATLLDVKGRILADLHVLARADGYWLETEATATAEVIERLSKYIVADDVELRDRSGEFTRIGVEGPRAAEVLAACLDRALDLAPEAGGDFEFAGVPIVAAQYGWSRSPGFQLFIPAADAARVADALTSAGAPEASAEVLEILRIEAGTPRLGAELASDVFPAEARLERAIATDKGCYVGQEIVERLRSRGHVNHILVGFRMDEPGPPELGAQVVVAGKGVGEITSVATSARCGAIALGFIRLPHDAPGTAVEVAGRPALVCALPFEGTS